MQIVFNWHLTEICNYSCKYCFAKWNATNEIWKDIELVNTLFTEISSCRKHPIFEESKFKKEKRIRVNFVGGEPLTIGNSLLELIKLAKKHHLEPSIVTNASLLEKHTDIIGHIETLGISIDSFNKMTNNSIGRCSQAGKTLSKNEILDIINIARKINPTIKIKTNTVVSTFNWDEIPINIIRTFNPDKIKIFRQLPFNRIDGITNNMFRSFLNRNKIETTDYIEDNIDMTESYLMINPKGQLFQNGHLSSYTYSPPIHEVGFHKAMSTIKFDIQKYTNRYKG